MNPSPSARPGFTRTLRNLLVVPALILGATTTVAVLVLPARQAAAIVVPVTLAAGIVEVVAVPTALWRLASDPRNRAPLNIGMTVLGSLAFLPFLLAYLITMLT